MGDRREMYAAASDGWNFGGLIFGPLSSGKTVSEAVLKRSLQSRTATDQAAGSKNA